MFAEALRMEIAAAGDNHKALRRVARALLNEAYSGNIAAIAMIADRIDGKVPQPTGGSDELSDFTSAGALSSAMPSTTARWRLQRPTKGTL